MDVAIMATITTPAGAAILITVMGMPIVADTARTMSRTDVAITGIRATITSPAGAATRVTIMDTLVMGTAHSMWRMDMVITATLTAIRDMGTRDMGTWPVGVISGAATNPPTITGIVVRAATRTEIATVAEAVK
jgi:hypothetical protein